jgi:hypothetical protein
MLAAESREHPPAGDGHTALRPREARLVLPDDFAGRAVQREHVALGGLHVQATADRDRRALLRPVGRASFQVIEPGAAEPGDVLRSDLGE